VAHALEGRTSFADATIPTWLPLSVKLREALHPPRLGDVTVVVAAFESVGSCDESEGENDGLPAMLSADAMLFLSLEST
jgi:hypothetical protein